MIVLSYGYKKPQTPDKGAVVFPAMEDNIQRLNDHNHDGTNSAALPGSSIVGVTVNIPSGSWVSLGGGHYRQSVTFPAGYSFDTKTISIRISTGDYVFATIEKISATQFWVYTIDSSLSYVAVIGG